MSRRRDRNPIPVILALPAEPPSQDEIDIILMAADGIIDRAGRSGLTLILAGSKSKRVLEKEWDKVRGYGALGHLTNEVIGTKVDWCIHHGWLRIGYDQDVPLLYHTDKGWQRVQRLWVALLIDEFTEWAASNTPAQVWPYMEPINREIKFKLLDKIATDKRRDLAPVLAAWFPLEVRKIRAAINHTLDQLGCKQLVHPHDPPPNQPPPPAE